MSASHAQRVDPVPDRVQESSRFLQQHGLWHLPSGNKPVRSCPDAARQRRRLGYVGIPLCDELKSLFYSYENSHGARRYVLLHCRGHQRLDLAKVARAVGSDVVRVESAELAFRFGAEYGTVTPLLFGDGCGITHVVDETVLTPFYPPYTMMTNAGSLEHAVEFKPAELFAALPGVTVADIAVTAHKRVPREVLGILTGNAPESGMVLWAKVNDRLRTDARVRNRGDTMFPHIIIDSIPGMGGSMELPQRTADVRSLVLEGVDRLCRAGATSIGVACNTTQYLAREIESVCEPYGARLVSLPEETAAFLRRENITSFDFLGIEAVTDLDGWSGFGRALEGFDVRVPDPGQLRAITQLAFDVKQETDSPAAINRLRDLVNRATCHDTVVVALTEVSILLARQRGRPRSGKRLVDTLDILADSMVEIFVEERIATGGA